MKFSTKGRYGLTIIVALGKQYGEGPIALRTIAAEHNLSEAYLEQIVSPLRNAGLVKSVRGAYGGYMLSNKPDEITAGDVIRVLEGPIQIVEGIEEEEPPQRELWMRIRDAVKNVLDTTTIEDLAKYTEDNPDDTGYMFYI
ncbi:cysteine metabolism transcriptional regulator CymR [Psychrobacillus soli]|uniref:Rrf2 family transcriptional regulator n=1 Tax=Psychrobacillus soli TaxID=1543965 RepID=A0A544TBL6_9BACI|nr:Rrf2 family transcriptional regulator [Psychrobacillus soli]TQR14789.1 Rrf2 family transcriptional regulator [Psychrobacillus soli]